MNNEKGFFLPYVLFITTIVFLLLTMSIKKYHQEIDMTYHHMEQLRIETLFQMAREELKLQILKDPQSSGSVAYNFPDGYVKVTYHELQTEHYKLLLSVQTINDSTYEFIHHMKLNIQD